MKTLKFQFLLITLCLSLLLSGCSILSVLGGSEDPDDTGGETLDTFDLVADEKMVFKDANENQYYSLILHAGENYQIKTTVDEKLGDDYYSHTPPTMK